MRIMFVRKKLTEILLLQYKISIISNYYADIFSYSSPSVLIGFFFRDFKTSLRYYSELTEIVFKRRRKVLLELKSLMHEAEQKSAQSITP